MLKRTKANRGFTLIELIISLSLGLIVIGAATSFAVTTLRTVGASEIRENVARNARFVALSLERDLQQTGVGIESTLAFGTLRVVNDTIIIFRVPYDPDQAPVHDILPGAESSSSGWLLGQADGGSVVWS